jgi:hypothetical protein
MSLVLKALKEAPHQMLTLSELKEKSGIDGEVLDYLLNGYQEINILTRKGDIITLIAQPDDYYLCQQYSYMHKRAGEVMQSIADNGLKQSYNDILSKNNLLKKEELDVILKEYEDLDCIYREGDIIFFTDKTKAIYVNAITNTTRQ